MHDRLNEIKERIKGYGLNRVALKELKKVLSNDIINI